MPLIALAIVVTYARSYYEIITGYRAGYLDSGTGIVFSALVRWFQINLMIYFRSTEITALIFRW